RHTNPTKEKTMKFRSRATAALVLAGVLLVGHIPAAEARSGHGGQEEAQGIRLVKLLYKDVFTSHDLVKAGDYIRDDYIQHTPTVPQGLEGFRQFYGGFFFPTFPDMTAKLDIISAHNNLVTSMSTWAGHHGPSGKYVVLRTANLYRIQDGKLAEHWEAVDFAPLKEFGIDPPRNDQPSTPIDLTGSRRQKANMRLALNFIDDIFTHRRLNRSARYVGRNIVQHDPKITSGLAGFEKCVGDAFAYVPDATYRLRHVIAADNRVTIFWTWTGHVAATGAAIRIEQADSYRVSHGKLVDHWDVVDTTFPTA
ncbi:MAG: ester cyclase, partial [Streptosporangiaceae bacterium]